MERIIKNIAVMEITSSAIKFAVGYSLDKTPHILHYKRLPLEGYVDGGRITDPVAFGKAISELMLIDDEDLKLKVNTNRINLILPPIGFQAFQNSKTTTLVNETVEQIDIINVMSLIDKEQAPKGNRIVNIVPEYYLLDNAAPFYMNPPFGNKARCISLNAMIYTLPDDIFNKYAQSATQAGFHIDKTSVSVSCATQLLLTESGMPNRYFYIDIGAKLTTIALVANGSPYGSLVVTRGGEELTESIAQNLNISKEEATELKIRFGYDERSTKYSTPILSKINENGTKTIITQAKLNEIIKGYYEQHAYYIDSAIKTLSKTQLKAQNMPDEDMSKFENLPIVISGGASMLKGLEKVLSPLKNGGSRAIKIYIPSCLGARSAEATNIIGLIIAQGEYKGSAEEGTRRVSTITRG